jgi:phosphoribosyl isomerase A
MKALQLFPAVDVSDGHAINLERTRTAGEDPVTISLHWQEQGASWIHLVDLDQAFGRGNNFTLLSQVIAELDLPVQLSGGIVDQGTLDKALSTEAARIVLGCGALSKLDWLIDVVKEHRERIAIGLDVITTDGHQILQPRGSADELGPLLPTLERLNAAGIARVIITDNSLDGTMSGVNMDLIQLVCQSTPAAVIASGGVGELADLVQLRSMTSRGVEGAIVGRALYQRAFTLPEAIEIAGTQT